MKRLIIVLAVLILATLPSFAQYGGRWEILRAEYGSGNTWVDVTGSVRSLVSANALSFRVTNEVLGGDPTPGRAKTLRLRLRDEYGRESVQTFLEKDSVNLTLVTSAAGWGALRITRAIYGVSDRFIDVTDRLTALVQNNQLSLRVTNDAMGGNPAYDARKTLTVWYAYNGNDSQITVNEDEYLNLPGSSMVSGGGLQVLRADYGADNRYRDVTSRLNARIQGNQLSLRVTNDTMGGDPADDHRKTLTVWYTYNGQVAEAIINEGDSLSLPGYNDFFQGNLHILRAQYGAGSRYFDVTDRLNSQIQGKQLSLRVTNDTMGGDPADDKHKQLTVSYIYNGQQGRVVVEEKDYLNLPGSGSAWSGDSGGLQILEATYGAGERRRDVTSRLISQVSGDQLQVLVSNSTMGGDPAEGQQKRLRVIYLWQGLRYHTSAAERETLIIP